MSMRLTRTTILTRSGDTISAVLIKQSTPVPVLCSLLLFWQQCTIFDIVLQQVSTSVDCSIDTADIVSLLLVNKYQMKKAECIKTHRL